MIGAELERLSYRELAILAGKWIAMEVYDRETLPVRRIAAVGDTPAECIQQLVAKGLDVGKYEVRSMKAPG